MDDGFRGVCLDEFYRDVEDLSRNGPACHPFFSRTESSSGRNADRPPPTGLFDRRADRRTHLRYLQKTIHPDAGLPVDGNQPYSFGFSGWLWINLFGIALIGIGGGLIESSSNPLLIQLFPGRESMVMNLHHFFFALGSLAGPLIMGAVLVRAIPWQWAYIGFGLFALSIFLFLLLQKSSASRKKSSFDTKRIKSLLRENNFPPPLLCHLFNSGVQNGIAFWMVTFLKDIKGLPDFPGQLLALSLFCMPGPGAAFLKLPDYPVSRDHLSPKSFLASFDWVVFRCLFPGKMVHPLFRPLWARTFRGLPFPPRNDREDLF